MNRILIFLAVTTAVIVGAHFAVQRSRRAPIEQRFIAHALGRLDGKSYLNCRECFERSYARGFRMFEMDLLESSDGYIVGMHNGFEWLFGLPRPFTLQQFKSSRPGGAFSPLDLPGVIDLMKRYPDWTLITDLKSHLSRGLPIIVSALEAAKIDWSIRVIPQIYERSQIDFIRARRFKRAILSLGPLEEGEFERIVEFIETAPEISAVALEQSSFSEAKVASLATHGVQTLVYTVNEPGEARSLFERGAAAIYTDSLFDASLGSAPLR